MRSQEESGQRLEAPAGAAAVGTVLTWGNHVRGRLGDGTAIDRTVPKSIVIPGVVTAMAAGGSHSVVLLDNGTMLAWGDNRKGQLGDNTTVDRNLPVQVRRDLPGQVQGKVAMVAVGGNHSVALLEDGTMLACGDSENGQIGLGNAGPGTGVGGTRNIPQTVVRGGSNTSAKVVQVTAGLDHSLGLTQQGTVVAWGANDYGQLGDDRSIDRVTANPVPSVDRATAVAAGFFHSLALVRDGSVRSWGDNSIGQLGGTAAERANTVRVERLGGVTMVAAHGFHSLALMSNGRVFAWGANSRGQLGDGTTTDRATPVQVQDLGGDVTAIAAGMDCSLALLSDGSVLAWGDNTYGQLGDGTTNRRLTPVLVEDPDPDTAQQFLSGVARVTAGANHTQALT